MMWLFGIWLLPAALSLLANGGRLTPAADRSAAGILLYLTGILILIPGAVYVSASAYEQSTGRPPWPGVWLACLVPALLIALGLRLQTRWSWERCFVWGAAGACVGPAAGVACRAVF
jgi:hypothetical protein